MKSFSPACWRDRAAAIPAIPAPRIKTLQCFPHGPVVGIVISAVGASCGTEHVTQQRDRNANTPWRVGLGWGYPASRVSSPWREGGRGRRLCQPLRDSLIHRSSEKTDESVRFRTCLTSFRVVRMRNAESWWHFTRPRCVVKKNTPVCGQPITFPLINLCAILLHVVGQFQSDRLHNFATCVAAVYMWHRISDNFTFWKWLRKTNTNRTRAMR